MDHFGYRFGELSCEDVPVSRIAEAVGTPAYIYSAATFRDHYDAVAAAFRVLDPLICYSVKCCANIHICRLLQRCGCGFDVVSGGEIVRALEAGGDPAKIVFAGVGKTDAEIAQAMDAGVGMFNVESEAELRNLVEIAGRRGQKVNAALRVNPDVDPRTHRYTTTGLKENKFGVDLVSARGLFHQYGRQEAVRLRGIHLHIGSPVNAVEPYVEAIEKGLRLIEDLRGDGFDLDILDIGGGFGAHYKAGEALPPLDYAEAIVPLLVGRGLRIIMEPGRSIAANAGILVTRVLYQKDSGEKRFVIVDAGMNDLIRPALYDAYHFIWPVRPPAGLEPNRAATVRERSPIESRVGLVPPADDLADDLEPNRAATVRERSPIELRAGRVPSVDDLVDDQRRAEPALPDEDYGRRAGPALLGLAIVDVVGPVCESGDFLAKDRPLPPLNRGDLLAAFSAGAYGMVMASNYNSRPRPPEVLVDGDNFHTIRRRETYDDLLTPERI